MQKIRLRIFAEEGAPRPAAEEGLNFGARRELLLNRVVTLADARRQDPLHHLAVRGGRKIGAADGRVRGEVFTGRRDAQPG